MMSAASSETQQYSSSLTNATVPSSTSPPQSDTLSLWATAKRAQRYFMATNQKVMERFGVGRNETDEKLAAQLTSFETLKSQHSRLQRLGRKQADLLKNLQVVEAEMGELLVQMSEADAGSVMGKCLKMNGEVLGQLNEAKIPAVIATQKFAESLESSFAKSLEDMAASVAKYDAARRESLATQKQLQKAQETEKREDKLAIIQHDLEEVNRKYHHLSFDLQQKLVLLNEHRSRELSLRISETVEAFRSMHQESSQKAFSRWVRYEFRESDSQAAVEAAGNRELEHQNQTNGHHNGYHNGENGQQQQQQQQQQQPHALQHQQFYGYSASNGNGNGNGIQESSSSHGQYYQQQLSGYPSAPLAHSIYSDPSQQFTQSIYTSSTTPQALFPSAVSRGYPQ